MLWLLFGRRKVLLCRGVNFKDVGQLGGLLRSLPLEPVLDYPIHGEIRVGITCMTSFTRLLAEDI